MLTLAAASRPRRWKGEREILRHEAGGEFIPSALLSERSGGMRRLVPIGGADAGAPAAAIAALDVGLAYPRVAGSAGHLGAHERRPVLEPAAVHAPNPSGEEQRQRLVPGLFA